MSKIRENSLKMSVCGISLLAMAGCVGTAGNSASAPGSNNTPSAKSVTAPVTQKQRFVRAIEHLEYGREAEASEMLNSYLRISPKSKNARLLLDQITTDPSDYFPDEFFTVNLESGESLSTLSRKYLGSALKFYALAKYNNIENPSRVNVGQKINVPLTEQAKSIVARENGETPAPMPSEPATTETEVVVSSEVKAPKLPEEKHDEPIVDPTSIVTEAPAPEVKVISANDLLSQASTLVASADFGEAISKLEELRTYGEFTQDIRKLAVTAFLGHANQVADSNGQLASERFTEAGQMQLINGDEMGALDSFSKASELNPENTVAMEDRMILQKEIADKYHREASSAFRRQELDTAIENWNKVLEVDPDHSSAKVYLAQAKELKDRLEQINN